MTQDMFLYERNNEKYNIFQTIQFFRNPGRTDDKFVVDIKSLFNRIQYKSKEELKLLDDELTEIRETVYKERYMLLKKLITWNCNVEYRET